MKKTFLIITLTLMTLLSLSACSSGYPGSSEQASSSGSGDNGQDPNPTVSTPAHCSIYFHESGTTISAKMKSYFDNFGAYNSNYVRVKFTAVPTSFANSDDIYIEFYKWKVAPNGTSVEQDPTPLQFRLENQNGQPVSGYFGQNSNGQNVGFNRQALYQIAGVQDNEKLREYTLVVSLNDPGMLYQVLRIVLTNSSGGTSTPTAWSSALITNYEANPNIYNDTHPNVLNPFHPNWSRRNDGYTSQQYKALAEQPCNPW